MKATTRILRLCLIGLLTGLTVSLAAFPFWLDAPKRSNPRDPKSPQYIAPSPTMVPFPTSTSTFTVSPTPSMTPTPEFTDPRDPADDTLVGANTGSAAGGSYSQTMSWIGAASDSADYYSITVNPGLAYDIVVTVTGASGTVNLDVDADSSVEASGTSGASVLGHVASGTPLLLLITSSGNLQYSVSVTELLVLPSATATPTVSPSFTMTATPSASPTISPTFTPGPAYPAGMIDDGEDSDTAIAVFEGRDGSWYIADDGSAVPAIALENAATGYLSSRSLRIYGGSTTPVGTYANLGLSFLSGGGPFDASAWNGIQFWARAETGTQTDGVIEISDGTNTAQIPITLTDTWASYDIAFANNALLDPAMVQTFQLVLYSGMAVDAYIDDITFTTMAATPTPTPPPCFVIPGGPPVTSDPWFDDTAGKTFGSNGAAWAAPDDTALGATAPSSNTESTADPYAGTSHMDLHLEWAAVGSWWAGSGYNIAGWWDPGPPYLNTFDMNNYDTISFYMKAAPGSVDPVSGIMIALTDNTGAPTSTSGALVVTGTYGPDPVPATWTRYEVPLCDFDFSTCDETVIWEVQIAAGPTETGNIDFYFDNGYFNKY